MNQSEIAWVSNILGSHMKRIHKPIYKNTKKEIWKLWLDNTTFLSWKHQQLSPIVFFDRVALGNPGVAGARGVLIGSNGKNILEYSWGMGHKTNNKA
jgi:hypothetical protein